MAEGNQLVTAPAKIRECGDVNNLHPKIVIINHIDSTDKNMYLPLITNAMSGSILRCQVCNLTH